MGLRRRAITQHTDTLSVEVDVVPPERRVEHVSLERLDSPQFREARHDQQANGGHEDRRARLLLLACAHVARLDAPHVRICIPLGLVDRRMKPTVGAQTAFVRHLLHILQDLGLKAVGAFPIRFGVRRERVEVDGDI